jgi:hypothetical protein
MAGPDRNPRMSRRPGRVDGIREFAPGRLVVGLVVDLWRH